ncbi:MAG: hypothetical protein M1296_04730 [Chloroflexi bacterium]|nr:hypothetical protein [Chloroflexota bacterium]
MPAVMHGFAYTSYKHQSDQELLSRLSNALLVLKLHVQGRAGQQHAKAQDVPQQRETLVAFLDDLIAVTVGGATKLAFAGLADRFVQVNPADVPDRLAELRRLRQRLASGQAIRDHDFRILDSLQALLEAEAAEDVRSLYRL